MHLSNEIQGQLQKLDSTVKLASTIDGVFPNRYAFYNQPGRSFRTEFAMSEEDFSIVLFERTDKLSYENCFARGLFTDIERLSGVIDLWIGKKIDIQDIQREFKELELYIDFETRNPDADIDKAWTKVKNMFFNDTEYWKDTEWNSRYIDLLNEAKRHPAFKTYFPFTSHYFLRFSIDKHLMKTSPIGIHIVPTMYSNEISDTLGKFYVSFNEKPMGGQFFENAREALDFYASKLKEIKPFTGD
jgi:hypothetical protein